MIVRGMARYSRILLALLVVLAISGLVMGLKATPVSESRTPDVSDASADSDPSVTCIPFGLYGDITAPPVVGSLSDGSDNLTFVGTANGLYVVAPGGKLHHFLYSPFGIKHMALIDDITGDGLREVVVALDDTQVPALRCYDGVTWEEVWRFAPVARIWDKLWVECQRSITNLEVLEDGDSQELLITSGRCVLSVDAKVGMELWRFTASSSLWRMVTLADLNGDDADEVLVGSDGGHLVWLSATTGKERWQTRLPRHDEVNYNEITHLVSDIVVLDDESGKVVVASGDGSVQMYDLRAKRREWDTLVFVREDPHNPVTSNYLLMSPTADITGDGLAEVLLSKISYDSQYSYRYSGAMTNGARALCDSTGNVVWQRGTSREGASVWPGMAFETDVFEGHPVYLDRAEDQATIQMVDLKDGESVLHTISLDALNGAGVIVKQPGGDGYLAFSSNGDLAAISATGALLWHHPRVSNVKAVKGSFVGDGTEDVLLCGESGGESYLEPGVRLLRMMDGATRTTAWSYEMPYGETKSGGGLKGVQVIADTVGSDNIQDITGYRGDSVLIFSSKNGAVASFSAGQSIVSLNVIRNGSSGHAFAVGFASGLGIFDSAGTSLWTTTTADWIGEESGSFMALDDVNSDNVSDLAVISNSRIVMLRSHGHASNYELLQTILPETGLSIRLPEVVADSDKDGIRELAFFQEGAQEQSHEQGYVPPHNLLCVQSPEDGRCLFKVELQTTLAYDLACGDFNGDGYPDSVLLLDWYETDAKGNLGGNRWLRVLSGKDGGLVWQRVCETYGSSYSFGSGSSSIGNSEVPAMNVGDMNGDGSDDLACSVAQLELSGSVRQQRLQVFDVAHEATLKDIAVSPRLHVRSFGDYFDIGADEAMLQADLDADGRLEVIMMVAEPSMPSYDPDAYTAHYDSGSGRPQYLALLDPDTDRRLSAFTGFRTATMSLFESHQPGILGVAACGGVCYLRIGTALQVISPDDGASTSPIVRVKWEGSADGTFSQVFVDGVRNDITNSFESELFLGRGNHTLLVRSVDDCGQISYYPADLSSPMAIKVAPSPWKPVWLVLSLFALLAIVMLLLYARLHRTWRAGRRAVK